MLDQVGNQNVGFLMTRLTYLYLISNHTLQLMAERKDSFGCSLFKHKIPVFFRGWQGAVAYGCHNLVVVIETKTVQVKLSYIWHIIRYELRREKTCLWGFRPGLSLSRSDTNWALQPLKMARGLKFGFR